MILPFGKCLVIIPAYNEADNIVDTVNSVIASGFDYVVVNDGSLDSTLEICRDNGFNVLDLPQNLGIGGAVQAGHKYAKRHGYDIDIQFDGDGQHDASYLPLLVQEVENGHDIAVGSRFIQENDGFQSTFMRRVGIKWLSFWIKLLTGKKIYDPTSGFRACGKRAIAMFSAHYPIDYPEPDSLAHAIKRGLSINEIPVEMHERQGGTSSIGGFSSVYYMIKVSLAILIACFVRKTGE